jgi:hypothetical protein
VFDVYGGGDAEEEVGYGHHHFADPASIVNTLLVAEEHNV